MIFVIKLRSEVCYWIQAWCHVCVILWRHKGLGVTVDMLKMQYNRLHCAITCEPLTTPSLVGQLTDQRLDKWHPRHCLVSLSYYRHHSMIVQWYVYLLQVRLWETQKQACIHFLTILIGSGEFLIYAWHVEVITWCVDARLFWYQGTLYRVSFQTVRLYIHVCMFNFHPIKEVQTINALFLL
jgi:hypothetical protein